MLRTFQCFNEPLTTKVARLYKPTTSAINYKDLHPYFGHSGVIKHAEIKIRFQLLALSHVTYSRNNCEKCYAFWKFNNWNMMSRRRMGWVFTWLLQGQFYGEQRLLVIKKTQIFVSIVSLWYKETKCVIKSKYFQMNNSSNQVWKNKIAIFSNFFWVCYTVVKPSVGQIKWFKVYNKAG